jgi:hypothetical protein
MTQDERFAEEYAIFNEALNQIIRAKLNEAADKGVLPSIIDGLVDDE